MQFFSIRAHSWYAVLLFLAYTSVYAQNKHPLTGTITSQTSEPLPGISVIIDGTNQYAVSDLDGHYTLSVSSGDKLTVSGIGFVTQTINVGDRTTINIILKEDNKILDEVVVVGYATQKRSDLTGSVSSVDNTLLQNRPVTSLDQAIQGAVPGVQVTQTSGQPGGGVSIRVRGGGSIQGGNEPLYVIDGFPIYNTSLTSGVISGAVSNPLSAINPADIASIDILKDASATAIYGSRGANGVVIVTTKQGKSGKAKVSYETSYGFQSLRKKIGLLNAQQFAVLRNEALYDRTPANGQNQYLSNEAISQLGNGTDWQDEAFRTAALQNHQLTVQGGTDTTQYSVSGGYFSQDGILDNTGFNRISLRSNLTSKVSDNFKIGVNISGSRTINNTAPSGVVSALLTMPATATIYDANGNYTLRNPFENLIANPIASLREQENTSRSLRLLGTVYGEYTFLKDFKLKVSVGADNNAIKEQSYIPSTLYEGSLVGGQGRLGAIETTSWLNENTLTYSKNIDVHSFDALVGFTQQEFTGESFTSGSQDFVTDDLGANNLGSGANPLIPTSEVYKWSLLSYLGRVNYNYDNKYYITGSFRADGSSKFGKNNKWGYFPSVAGAWKVSNETFYGSLANTVSNLKLRASYGLTGNQEIGVYQSLSTLSPVQLLLGDTFITGFTPDRISNSDLSWEKTTQTDVGIDIGLFSNRIVLTVDAYYKKTTDLLLNVEIPWTTGYSTSLQNYGSVENKGLEIGLSTINFEGDFNWNSNFNISFNRNKVLKIGDGSNNYILGGNSNGDFILQVGQPVGSYYGAVANGILQPGQEATLGALTGRTNPKAGDMLYLDIDGDGRFSTAADRRIIGNAQPDFIFGFTNNFSYKGFDLSILLQGSVGNDILNGNRQSLELLTGQQNASAEAANRWSPENPTSNIPRASSDPSNIFLDRFVEDGSYLRVKNVVLGYSFNKNITSLFKLQELRFYISAQNLLTWTNYTGYDPEVTSAGNTITQGYDSGVYPVSRTISGGIHVSF